MEEADDFGRTEVSTAGWDWINRGKAKQTREK